MYHRQDQGLELLYPEPLRLQWRAPASLVKQARPQWRESTWLGEDSSANNGFSEPLFADWPSGPSEPRPSHSHVSTRTSLRACFTSRISASGGRALLQERGLWLEQAAPYRFTTYQDARRVRLVDGLIFETNILRVSPVKPRPTAKRHMFLMVINYKSYFILV